MCCPTRAGSRSRSARPTKRRTRSVCFEWPTSGRRRRGGPTPERTRIFAVTGDEVVRLTLTGTRAHDRQTALAVADPRCIAVDPHDPNRVYVGTFDDGLYASDDGGESWREAWHGIKDRRVPAVSVSRSHVHEGVSVVYAGTEPSNLYRSEDGGKTWQLLPPLRQGASEPPWYFPPRPWCRPGR